MKHKIVSPPVGENVNISRRHPLIDLLVLGGGLIALVVGVIIGLTFGVEWAALQVSPETEMATFGAALRRFESTSDPRHARVQRILDNLIAAAPPSGYRVRLSVMAESQPNAFAVIGGGLVVTTGLLDLVESENELAFVLSHELGHFAHRDQIRGLSKGIAISLVLGAITGSSFGGSADSLIALAQESSMKGYSRAQEFAADRFGLTVLARRYGHIGGATDFFEKMQEREENIRGRASSKHRGIKRRISRYFSTHPGTQDRILALKRQAQSADWSEDGALQPLPPQWRKE